MPGPHRRTVLRTAPLLALPLSAGCSLSSDRPDVSLRFLRVINLSERQLSVRVTASPWDGTTAPRTLYDGSVDTQSGDDGGEVVFQPAEIEDPLRYDYRLSIADGVEDTLASETLVSAYRSVRSGSSPEGQSGDPLECVEIDFGIRKPTVEAAVWGNPYFWGPCDSVSGSDE